MELDDIPSFTVRAEDLERQARIGAQRAKPRKRVNGEGRQADVAGWPEPLDLEALAEREATLPEFVVEGWIPCGYATLFAGHGGAGKSSIVLYLMTCIAAGKPFFGKPVKRRRVFFASCEDRESILHWRLRRMCDHLGISLANLRGWLDIVDLVGHPSILWERDPQTGHAITSAYGFLAAAIERQEAQVLALDGVTDIYGGNENLRGEVKAFVNALLGLMPDDGAVALIGHVNRITASGANTTEGYSGSTAWHNSVRSRLYLREEKPDDDASGESNGGLILELQKANLGPSGEQMRFKWDDDAHVFVGELVSTLRFDRKHRDREEQAGILRTLRVCAEQKVMVPAATTGQRTAYHVTLMQADFPQSLRGDTPPVRRRFWRQIEALRQMHLIEHTSYRRPNRHLTEQISLTTEGMRRCAEY